MKITKKSWVKEWTLYQGAKGTGPAKTYYHKSDIAVCLNHYKDGANYNETNLPAPSNDWNGFTDVAGVVTCNVEPYRIEWL